MPSTIRIKRSSVAGKRPTTSDISTGELAINTKDFKLFSSNGTAVFELGNAGALANTNARINLINTNLLATNTALRAIDATKLAVSNAATLYATKSNPTTSGLLAHTGRATISTNLAVSGNASVTGTMTASGTISGLELISTNASGDEGGEIKLTKPPNGTLSGGVTIDAYQNRIRFFEQGGSARGAYIDLSACAGGAATNLLASSGGATWAALTSTNTALRTLISDRLQVANAAATYQTKAVERAALANTNSSIATQTARITLVNTNLTGTNTALRTLINARMQVSNVNTLVAARATWTALTGTNTALRTLISDRLQVANASTLYTTKSNPTTSGLLAHTGRATISTNLTVSGNVSVSGTSSLSNITVAQGSQAYFYHASQTDANDGRIGAGTFDTGLNIVGVQTAAATGRIVRLYGSVVTNTDYRGPIYYDSNNTAFYVDPASTSVLNNVYLDGTVYMRGTEASQTLTDAATIAWDTNSGRIATVTLGASRTIGAPTNAKVGTYVLYVIQGGTGSYNITWNSVFKWPGGVAPTLSTAVGRRDIFTFIYDGTNFYGSYINDVR